jgi:hypothetical protein
MRSETVTAQIALVHFTLFLFLLPGPLIFRLGFVMFSILLHDLSWKRSSSHTPSTVRLVFYEATYFMTYMQGEQNNHAWICLNSSGRTRAKPKSWAGTLQDNC